MIPTTLTANTPIASGLNSSGNIGNQQNLMATSSKEMIVGIASLIIEGRAFAEDEFHTLSLRQTTPFTTRGSPNNSNNIDSHEIPYSSSPSAASTSLLLHGCDIGGGNSNFGAAGFGGRQSPKPSTSKAATGVTSNSNMPHLINITTNPHHAFGASTAPLFIETPNAYHSSSSAASSAESTHQRWTQKLCQLRQASGTANLTAPFEQKVAIDTAQIASGEPELVSLAIHDTSMVAERGSNSGEYEIVRRVMLSRSSAAAAASNSANAAGSVSSSPSSGGSENFLHSLQSLATTCLRGSSPSMDSPTGLHYPNSGNSYNKYNAYRATSTTTPRFHSPYTSLDLHSGSASSSGSGIQSPKLASIASCHKRGSKVTSTVTSSVGSSTFSVPSAFTSKPSSATPAYVASTSAAAASSISSSNKSLSANSNSYPQQGPHCDQFLRKMGLAKGEATEAEEHYCDMSYVNITCSRWRAYCLKIEGIIERGEPICLEVFLGPSNHRILVEQWIITYKEKVPPPTMTLPSLCSAIRSQLYFSQISAWCDLIRKSDKSIYDTGRIVFGGAAGMMGCAGDLATTTPTTNLSCTPPNNSTNTGPLASGSTVTSGTNSSSATAATSTITCASLRPRLNVFYRIRSHDATACFNSKPNIHNFPNVNISEYCSISICLKSLPRINGGIPKLGAMMTAPNDNFMAANTAAAAKFSIDETPRSSRHHMVKMISSSPSTSSATASIVTTSMASSSTKASAAACFSNCDNRKQQKNALGNGSCSVNSNGSSSTKVANFNRYKNNTEQMMLSDNSNATKTKEIENKSKNAAASLSSSSSAYPTNVNTQKCTFYIDECEQDFLNEHDDDNDTDDLNTSHCSNGSCGSISHREKQLQKYRKRMLKRDKKHHNHKSFEEDSNLNNNNKQQHQQCQPMDQGDDDNEDENESEQLSVQTVDLVTARQRFTNIEMISTGTQTAVTESCEQCGGEKTLICLKCMPNVSMGVDEMDACSVNSLSSSEIISTPRSKGDLLLQAIQRTPKAAKHKKQTSRSAGFLNTTNSAPALNVRTGRAHSMQNSNTLLNNNHLANRSNSVACTSSTIGANGVSPSSSTSSLASLGSGCQVCKRQKTQHNFSGFNSNDHDIIDHGNVEQNCESIHNRNENGISLNEADATENDDRDGGKVFNDNIENKKTSVCNSNGHCTAENKMETQLDQSLPVASSSSSSSVTMTSGAATEVMEEECFTSSTKLTPHFDRCALSNALSSCSNVALIQLHPPKKQPPPLPPKPLRRNQNNTDAAISSSSYQRSCTPPIPLSLNIDCEFKTPTSMANFQQGQQKQHQQKEKSYEDHESILKPNLLQVVNSISDQKMVAPCCGSSDCQNAPINGLTIQTSSQLNALQQRKILPKVNLTPIFCNSSNHCDGNACCKIQQHNMPISLNGSALLQSPDSAFPFDIVTINRIKYERAAAAEATAAAQSYTANKNNNNNNNNNNNINMNNNMNNNNNTATILNCNGSAVPVQKSYSAPTLPNSPSLSPRFAKQAAIYKRRSRHLSDRSDRSSLGSDEQFSDEDLDCGSNANLINGMAISPIKQRIRLATMFRRQPLIANLEESLFQKRITPKTEVLGFKVLLGASGLFCPTQLTIPAAAYFYELHGETLSTPYLCEIRLPRKGYSVPRTGTIQATLLNPLGTVVRMFVIPYDMGDMPPLHQTFIRQRILADMSATKIIGKEDANAMQTGETNTQQNEKLEKNIQIKNNQRSRINSGGDGCEEKNLGHFISPEHMKRLRYSIHLRFQTSRSGRLMLHTDIRLLISRRTDCDTAAAHAKGLPEAPNELITDTVMPSNPKYSVRQDVNSSNSNGIGNNRI